MAFANSASNPSKNNRGGFPYRSPNRGARDVDSRSSHYPYHNTSLGTERERRSMAHGRFKTTNASEGYPSFSVKNTPTMNENVLDEERCINTGTPDKIYFVNSKEYERMSLRAVWNVKKKLGHYSLTVDEECAVKWNTSGVKYFSPENCSSTADLFEGFSPERFCRKQELQDKYESSYPIYQLIEWLKENKQTMDEQPDFVIKHNLLKTLVLTPHFSNRSWNIEAVVHDGVIYINKIKKLSSGNKPSELHERRFQTSCYGGLKFEELVTWQPPGNCSERFYSIITGHLSEPCVSMPHFATGNRPVQLKFLLSAEIDAITGNSPVACENLMNYVELKTVINDTKVPMTKTLDWWAHCFLAGIPRLFLGIRSKSGILERTVLTNVNSIPGKEKIQRCQQPCIDFFYDLFTWIKTVVATPDTVYEFSYHREYGPYFKYSESRDPTHPFLKMFKKTTNVVVDLDSKGEIKM